MRGMMRCKQCGAWPLERLGNLGAWLWLRCRYCGWVQPRSPRKRKPRAAEPICRVPAPIPQEVKPCK